MLIPLAPHLLQWWGTKELFHLFGLSSAAGQMVCLTGVFLWRWNVENAPTLIFYAKSSFVKGEHTIRQDCRRNIIHIDTFNISKKFDNFHLTRMLLLFHNRVRVKMFFFEWGKLRTKAVKRNCFQRILLLLFYLIPLSGDVSWLYESISVMRNENKTYSEEGTQLCVIGRTQVELSIKLFAKKCGKLGPFFYHK